MARYKSSYDGERRTVIRATKLTPSEAAALDDEASRQGVNWSDFSRQAMLCRVGMPVITAKNRWDPKLVQALTSAGHAHSSVGNLLNQITGTSTWPGISAPLPPICAMRLPAITRSPRCTKPRS